MLFTISEMTSCLVASIFDFFQGTGLFAQAQAHNTGQASSSASYVEKTNSHKFTSVTFERSIRQERGNRASDSDYLTEWVPWNLVCQWCQMTEITWLNRALTWKHFYLTEVPCCKCVCNIHIKSSMQALICTNNKHLQKLNDIISHIPKQSKIKRMFHQQSYQKCSLGMVQFVQTNSYFQIKTSKYPQTAPQWQ